MNSSQCKDLPRGLVAAKDGATKPADDGVVACVLVFLDISCSLGIVLPKKVEMIVSTTAM